MHGEQGALNLSASLCHILRDPGAQEYAANQAREEARHVTAFAKYVQSRFGKPLPVGETLGGLLSEMVNAKEVYKKIVGMQLLVEGLAMGIFASLHSKSQDPVLRRLTQLVMTSAEAVPATVARTAAAAKVRIVQSPSLFEICFDPMTGGQPRMSSLASSIETLLPPRRSDTPVLAMIQH